VNVKEKNNKDSNKFSGIMRKKEESYLMELISPSSIGLNWHAHPKHPSVI
jgi:hypothetical protein